MINKMKRIKKKYIIFTSFIFVGIITIILTVIGFGLIKDNNIIDENPIYVSSSFFAGDEGFYFFDSYGFLKYYDYKTNKTIYLCNKPNSEHTVSDDNKEELDQCDAYIPGINKLFSYHNSLYIFVEKRDTEGNLQSLSLFKSDTDGKNRKLIKDFGNICMNSVAVYNENIYYDQYVYEEVKDEAGLPQSTGRSKASFCVFSLKKNKIIDQVDFDMAYGSYVGICSGKYDKNTIIFKYNYYDQDMRDEDDTNLEKYSSHMKNRYYSYNIKTKKRSRGLNI